MSNADERSQRQFNAIHAPLSEFFDAYVIIGYTAGTRDRLMMVNAGKEKVYMDALRVPIEAGQDWMAFGKEGDPE